MGGTSAAALTARLIALSAFILVLPVEENANASRFSQSFADIGSMYVRSDTKARHLEFNIHGEKN